MMLVRLRARVAWRHPEWWTIATSVITWLVLVGGSAMPAAGGTAIHLHHAESSVERSAAWLGSIAADTAAWMLMVAAMMFPLVLGPIKVTAARSLWARRHRAIVGFLVGYSIPWMILGASMLLLLSGLRVRTSPGSPAAAAIAFAAAMLWQGTAVRRRALVACHRTTPLAPAGWQADRDCVRQGWVVGVPCVVSCWPPMIACLLSGHNLLAMAGAGAIGFVERYAVRPDERLLRGGLAALAATFIVLGLGQR
jgi:hypothetical protein